MATDPSLQESRRNVKMIVAVVVVLAALAIGAIWFLFDNDSSISCGCIQIPTETPSSEMPAGRRYK